MKHNANADTSPIADCLLDFRAVHALIGSKCRTGHTARSLAARGLIREVRLSNRALRYSQNSVFALMAGKVSA